MQKGSRLAALATEKFLSLDGFLQAARAAGIEVTRRTLQFYYSPRLQLLPQPVYRGGHVAYFERRQLYRLKAINILQSRYRLSLSAIRELLEAISEEDIRTLAKGRVAPLSAQIVLHHLQLRNARRRRQERGLFETMVLLVEWHAWSLRKATVSSHRPSLRPCLLDKNVEVEVRQLVGQIIQHVSKRSTRED